MRKHPCSLCDRVLTLLISMGAIGAVVLIPPPWWLSVFITNMFTAGWFIETRPYMGEAE